MLSANIFSLFLLLLHALPTSAVPQKKGSDPGGGITKASDGSTILDKTVTIK